MDLQRAYVLHYRNYRETSLLADLLTQQAGCFCVIARGARRPKSLFKGLLQPFVLLDVAWRGRGELPTLSAAESYSVPIKFNAKQLFSGFYLNELLMRVLHRHSPCESIFTLYNETINLLGSECNTEIVLRKFEKQLLSALGYGLQLTREALSHNLIQSDANYVFTPEHGFTLITTQISSQAQAVVFSGKSLLAIAADEFHDVIVLRDAKRLMRLALQPLLGNKGIKSRELFASGNN